MQGLATVGTEGVAQGCSKWGGVAAVAGTVFGTPLNAETVLVLDAATGEVPPFRSKETNEYILSSAKHRENSVFKTEREPKE